MYILPGLEVNTLSVSGRVIGSACRGQTVLAGNFTMVSNELATITMYGQTMNLTLTGEDSMEVFLLCFPPPSLFTCC